MTPAWCMTYHVSNISDRALTERCVLEIHGHDPGQFIILYYLMN